MCGVPAKFVVLAHLLTPTAKTPATQARFADLANRRHYLKSTSFFSACVDSSKGGSQPVNKLASSPIRLLMGL